MILYCIRLKIATPPSPMPCDEYVNTTHSTLKVLPEASNGDIHSMSTDDFELPSLCVTAAPLQILC